jgi:hypothetical protein
MSAVYESRLKLAGLLLATCAGVLIGRRQASEHGPCHDHIGVDARPSARFPAFALA